MCKAKLFLRLLALAASLATFWGAGCSSTSSSAPLRLSARGEECRATADCGSGLACVPSGSGGGVCETSTNHIAQVPKSCVYIECSTPSDCCPPPSSQCTQLQTLCNDGGDAFECMQYQQLCTCSAYTCNNNTCGRMCQADSDCLGTGGHRCLGGACVQCTSDSDCTNPGEMCLGNVCQAPCKSDSQCPGFQRCTNGQCSASGCMTDRECAGFTGHADATCLSSLSGGGMGTCSVPCQSNLECSPDPARFNFTSCINSQCVYLGCESDKDCEFYHPPSDAGVGVFPNGYYVCQ